MVPQGAQTNPNCFMSSDHYSHSQFSNNNQYHSFYLGQTSKYKESSTAYCFKTLLIMLCKVQFEIHCVLLLSQPCGLRQFNVGDLCFLGGILTMFETVDLSKALQNA